MQEANVKLNPKKYSFAKQKVEYLGHVVTPEGVSPDPAKVRVVQDFAMHPDQIEGVEVFLGSRKLL